ncbi:putative diguanylate cyclase YcdT [compost metagenome]
MAFRRIVTAHKFNRQCPYVIVMDCDNFKQINDRLGHDIGDHLLHIVAEVILQNIGKRDLGARWGGDEFLILGLTTDSQELNELLENIRRDIDVAFQEHHWENTSVSIGAALYSEEHISLEKLISIADKNMYKNKSNKKAQIESSYQI